MRQSIRFFSFGSELSRVITMTNLDLQLFVWIDYNNIEKNINGRTDLEKRKNQRIYQ